MGLLWPAVGFLSFLYVLVPGAAQGHDPWRMHDLGRVLGWGILVFAIAKYDLLGLPWPQSAVRRAAVAGGALAVLFGVARVAQNFVSAESGLLLGVVFTVVFIFAVGRFKQAGQGKGKTNRAA
jgi:hypothetical protein